MTDPMPTDGLALAELMSPELARNPQPMYAMLRESSPVLRVDGVGVVVTSRSGVDQVLRDPGVFSSNMSAHDLKTERPADPAADRPAGPPDVPQDPRPDVRAAADAGCSRSRWPGS